MRQITKEEAIKIFESKLYEDWTPRQIVEFQIFQDRLAMPFSVFHEAIEIVLGRSVYTHEFANRDGLVAELIGDREPPTFDEIVAMIPQEKLIAIMPD